MDGTKSPTDALHYDAEHFARIAAAEPRHFWFAARRRLILRLVSRHLPEKGASFLDVGAGTGYIAGALADAGYDVTALDPFDEALKYIEENTAAKAVRGTADKLDFPDGSFGAVGMFDLLEHLDDDAAAVAEGARVLAPGGLLFATVPAYSGLFSRFDEICGHRRRYRRRELAALAEKAGLRVVRASYYNTGHLPFIYAARKLSRREPETLGDAREMRPGAAANAFFGALSSAEGALLRFLNMPAGASIFIVAKKGPGKEKRDA